MGNKNNFKLVLERLSDAQELLKVGVERGSLSSIERDILLEKLRASYEVILFDKNQLGDHNSTVEKSSKEPSIPTLPNGTKASPNPVPKEEKSLESGALPTEEPVSAKQDVAEVVKDVTSNSNEPINDDFSLEDEAEDKVEVEPVAKVENLKQDDLVLGTSEEESIQEDIVEGNGNGRGDYTSTILGEKFQGKKKFRNEVLGVGKKDMASHLKNKPISDLTKAIGINDKFLFTKELFNGNAELYAKSIRQLNSFEDINDALIYIQENFSWDEKNEAANQLIDLVRRKLLYD